MYYMKFNSLNNKMNSLLSPPIYLHIIKISHGQPSSKTKIQTRVKATTKNRGRISIASTSFKLCFGCVYMYIRQ